MNTEILLDVSELPPPQRHPKIFAAWEALPVGGVLKLVNDHDPKPLFYEFRAERHGEFEWTVVERGPRRWAVDISRIAPSSRKQITLADTVNEVAERHPALKEILARRGLDLCCGGVHPLAMAAQAHGVDPDALLAELNAALAPAPETAGAAPDWAVAPPAHEVDVREDLRNGGEPFAKILRAVAAVERGEVLLLRAIFEPKPLYKVMGLRGFEHWARQVAADDWEVFFRRKP
ncbi:MAG: DUF542 domain-containing protein [Elusimicrobia bacterium]|nr:DUF542 domain-containing protein [Elusimicrobiota bacterium]